MDNRSKIISGIFIVVLALLFYFFVLKREPTVINRDSRGETIIAFGDSLVQGVGSTENNNFISLLSKRIGQPILNLGISGNTTIDGLARIDEVLEKNPRPKIVILLLGGNDYLRKVPIKQTFENLDTIVKKIQAKGAMVLLLGVRGGLLRDTYNDSFENFADTHGVAFVPNVLDGIIGDDSLLSDAVHPNDKGYKKIADKVEPVLKKLLK